MQPADILNRDQSETIPTLEEQEQCILYSQRQKQANNGIPFPPRCNAKRLLGTDPITAVHIDK